MFANVWLLSTAINASIIQIKIVKLRGKKEKEIVSPACDKVAHNSFSFINISFSSVPDPKHREKEKPIFCRKNKHSVFAFPSRREFVLGDIIFGWQA